MTSPVSRTHLRATPAGVVVLPMVPAVRESLPADPHLRRVGAAAGAAVRYNLFYCRRRPERPLSGSAAADRAGVLEAPRVRGVAGDR